MIQSGKMLVKRAEEIVSGLSANRVGTVFLAALLVFVPVAAVLLLAFFLSFVSTHLYPISLPTSILEPKDIKKFASAEEFRTYLEESELGYAAGSVMLESALQKSVADFGEAVSAEKAAPGTAPAGTVPGRVSETTVQVVGIDEPDIVKTDGREIYFSPRQLSSRGWAEPKENRAFPPGDLATEAEIERTGDLLLEGDVLVIFSGETIYGYDVSDPESPRKMWDLGLGPKSRIVGARLYKGKIYLITQVPVDNDRPCPIEPLSANSVPLTIKCTDIYHPRERVPVDVTYTAMTLDPRDGEVRDSVSFVGHSASSIIYMSENAIYVTYPHYEDFVGFFYQFFGDEASDLVPSAVIAKLERSRNSSELQTVLEQHKNSLSADDRLKFENELANRMEDYYKRRGGELEKTDIVKIGLDGLRIQAVGNVSGQPLNQFSLDEYEGNLRVATTIGASAFGQRESANGVYVLDKNLRPIGEVVDLGLDERIYSVRFIEDKGYVVTFKEVDPFFVLDLSNPRKPELVGELKIPGYSSYLHPITKDRILGIGKEGSRVKISLFDVSVPKDPIEEDKYSLDEYWSDVLNTHHAFLLDKKHRVFFLPGNRGGYVFSYQGDRLRLEKAVSGVSARRAIYINDYLYIIGDDRLVVLNELDWTRVNQLEF